MSGGSYNYLCNKEFSGHAALEDLESMADRLSGLGYADDAARETMELLLMIRQFEIRGQLMADRLYGVWRAVEWWDSCDSSEEGLVKALKNYRKVK